MYLSIATVFSTFALFISFPIINVFDIEHLQLAMIEIGIIADTMPITSIFIGKINKSIGYKNGIKLGLFFSFISFTMMAITKNIYAFAFDFFLLGIGRSTFDNAILSSIMSYYSREEQRKNILNIKVLKGLNLRLLIFSCFLIIVSYGIYEEFMPIIALESGGKIPRYGFLVSLNGIISVICVSTYGCYYGKSFK